MFDATPLRVEFRARGRVALLSPLRWRTTTTHIVIPKGFETDGASIPPIMWPVMGHPLSGSLVKATTLHDWEIVTRHAPSPVVHRRFYEALRSLGVGRVRAALLYAAVRCFGPRFQQTAPLRGSHEGTP
jgi:hypothetical protein